MRIIFKGIHISSIHFAITISAILPQLHNELWQGESHCTYDLTVNNKRVLITDAAWQNKQNLKL